MNIAMRSIGLIAFIALTPLQPAMALQCLFPCCNTYDSLDSQEYFLEPHYACPCCLMCIDACQCCSGCITSCELGKPTTESTTKQSELPSILKQPPLILPRQNQNLLKVGALIIAIPNAVNEPKGAAYTNLLRINCSVYVLLVNIELQSDNKTWRVKAKARKTRTNITYTCEFSKEMTNANTSIVDAIALITEIIQEESPLCCC